MFYSNCMFLLREGQGLVLGKESSELSGGGARVAGSWSAVAMEREQGLEPKMGGEVQSVKHSCTGGDVFSAEQLSSFPSCSCVQ